jgi:hypothetical protein
MQIFTNIKNNSLNISSFRQPRTQQDILNELAETEHKLKSQQNEYKIIGNVEEELKKSEADDIVKKVKTKQYKQESIKIVEPIITKPIVKQTIKDDDLNKKLSEKFTKVSGNYFIVSKHIPTVLFNKTLMGIVNTIEDKKLIVSKESTESLEACKLNGKIFKIKLNGKLILFSFK